MAPRDERIELLKALGVTAELTGTDLSEAAARMMAEDLSAYPLQQVLVALTRCRRELKSRLTIAAVVERIDDGRPGADEAWAMIPMDEEPSCVWTEETANAWGIALPLIQQGDRVAARLAFRDAYNRMVADNRAANAPARWFASLGSDRKGRERALRDAVSRGRITGTYAAGLLPGFAQESNVVALPAAREPMPEHVRLQLKATLAKLTGEG